MLRQEKTRSTDTVVLVFDYLTVSLNLCVVASTLGRLIAFNGWRWKQCASWEESGALLCRLESCEEGELCLHAVHMALQMEDGMGEDAPNARAGCHQWMGAVRNRAAEGGEAPRSGEGGAGCWRTAWSLVNETRTKWGGEFK